MIHWYAQERRESYVPACIRMVLSGCGQAWPEKRLRRLLGLTAAGLSLDRACQRLRRHGAQADLYDDWDLLDLRDCLRAGWFPIVGVQRSIFGHPAAAHAVVVSKISKQAVSELDPLGNPQPQQIRLATFELAWRDVGHQVLVLKSPLRE